MSARTLIAVTAAALSIAGVSAGAGAERSRPAATMAANPSKTYSQLITIDGVQIEVLLQVTRIDATAVPQSRPQTSVSVTLRTTDGSNLPAHLSAAVVKLDRVNPPSRAFRQPLTPVVTFRFDPTTSGYEAIGGPAYRAGALLKATIRLETSTGVRYVRFASVRVNG